MLILWGARTCAFLSKNCSHYSKRVISSLSDHKVIVYHCREGRVFRSLNATLTTVRSQMNIQISNTCKLFVTLSTFEEFITTAYSQMNIQISNTCKLFVALSTFEGFLTTVNSQMNIQISDTCKLFFTLSTFEEFHTTVNSQVSNVICDNRY